MSILLSHNTALELMRAVPPQLVNFPRVEEPLDLDSFGTNLKELRSFDPRELGLSQPVTHVLCAAGERVSRARGIAVHRMRVRELPATSMVEVAPGILSAGPELCFIQMARETTFVGAVVLGYELCGRYSHFAKLVSGYYERPPLASVDKIAELIEELGHLYGLSRARRALEWVCDGSRSPMETVVSSELYLPGSEGGLGLVRPELNYEVRLDEVASAITGTSSCYVDVALPSVRRGFEYDSGTFHLDLVRDRRRREALEHMGWTIITIDLDQMIDHAELMKTVALFEDELPRQPGELARPEDAAKLHQRLLRATRFGMGIEGALFGIPVGHGEVTMHI